MAVLPGGRSLGDSLHEARPGEVRMTGSSLLTLSLLALTAAASPFSLIVFSLVLATDRGPRNGVAFICGWIVTVVLIGGVMLALGGAVDVSTSSAPRKWFMALQLALGTMLIILWVRRRFHRGEPEPEKKVTPVKSEPAWQRRIATLGYGGAFVLGGLTQTWPVMIAAGIEVATLDIPVVGALVWVLLFAVATTAGIVTLEVLALRHPGSAASRLDRIRNYVEHHRDSVINWAYLLGGLVLGYRGLIGLF
jgi:hypothetical protein